VASAGAEGKFQLGNALCSFGWSFILEKMRQQALDAFMPNSDFFYVISRRGWRSAETAITNFTVTDLKKKSIKWQILKCHDFSGCSAQNPIWKSQHPSPHRPCEPARLPRLCRIPGRIPVCAGFLREAPGCASRFSHEDISLAGVSERPLGVCPKRREGERVFWQFWSWLDHPSRLLTRYLPGPEPEPEHPAAQGALGAASSSEEWWVAQSPYQQ